MHIAIFTDGFFPYQCGVTFAVQNQANAMVRSGHQVAVFRPKPWINKKEHLLYRELDPVVQVFDLPLSFPYWKIADLHCSLPTVVSAFGKIKRFNPDVIHVHSEWGVGWEGMLTGKILNIPVLGTFHTFYAEPEYMRHFFVPNFNWTKKMFWKYSVAFFNRCDQVIAPSRIVKQQLMERGLNKPPMVVSNGIPESKLLDPSKIMQMRKEKGIKDFSFIYVGRVSYEKSMNELLEGFKKLTQKFPNVSLTIVGDGPSKNDVEEKIKSLKLTNSVRCLGNIPHDKLMQENIPLLGDVFVTASKTENQPLSILEAMTFGLPVIGPNAKGIPELVVNGENGILFEKGNSDHLSFAMEKLVRNPGKRIAMTSKSFATAKAHSIGSSAIKLEIIYDALKHGRTVTLPDVLHPAVDLA